MTRVYESGKLLTVRTGCLVSLLILGIMFLAFMKFLRNVQSDAVGVVRMYRKIFLLIPLLVRCYQVFS